MGVFKEIFVNFARETSIHGPNFLTHKSFFGQKRIIWALALLGIFTYCTYYQKSTIECKFDCITYCEVAGSNMSRLETHAGFFRLLMKGIFNPYRSTGIPPFTLLMWEHIKKHVKQKPGKSRFLVLKGDGK